MAKYSLEDSPLEDYQTDSVTELVKTGLGMVPIAGTMVDAYDFYKKPSLENAGWLGLSLVSDVLPFLKPIKGLKAARAATKAADAAAQLDRQRKLVKLNEARQRVSKLESQAARSGINPTKITKAKNARGKAYNAALMARPNSIRNAAVRADNDWFLKYALPAVGYNVATSLTQGTINQINLNNQYEKQ